MRSPELNRIRINCLGGLPNKKSSRWYILSVLIPSKRSQHELVNLEGALRVKEGNSLFLMFKKLLGWHCKRNDLELVTIGLICALVHTYSSSKKQALHELLSLRDRYRSQAKNKESVHGKRKRFCPLSVCQVPQIHAEEYLLDTMTLQAHRQL